MVDLTLKHIGSVSLDAINLDSPRNEADEFDVGIVDLILQNNNYSGSLPLETLWLLLSELHDY